MAERLPKVFINPNYKPLQGNNMIPLHQHNTIYINQKFSNGNLQHNNVSKIFINPNFLQAKQDRITMPFNMQVPLDNGLLNVNHHNSISQYQTLESNSSTSIPINAAANSRDENITIKSRYSFVRATQPLNISYHKHVNKLQQKVKENTHCQVKVSAMVQSPRVKSRYQLIRKNENKMSNCKSLEKSRLKISKYKVITVSNIQNNDIYNKKDIRPNFISSNVYVSKNKTVRSNITPRSLLNNSLIKMRSVKPVVLNNKYKIGLKNKILQTHIKRRCYQTEIENIKGKMKINNIPCPLFSKYGKCLRKMNGKCEYLHDKKHVALCRKFLKGVCHDENCSLSHELSMKKMPTCYFYLKGMCFKDSCPYLHVKLNEKAKVCQDFIRGYCEKGEDCSFRHVKAEIKRKLQEQISFSSSRDKKIVLVKNGRPKKKCETSVLITKERYTPETRYYKKIENEEPKCDSIKIKPTRCKLGTLPSFIQL